MLVASLKKLDCDTTDWQQLIYSYNKKSYFEYIKVITDDWFTKYTNITTKINGTVHFKNVNNYLNTDIYFYLETSGGKSSNLYLNVGHFFNTSIN